ncbi:class II fructose-bisphosphate aldolase [Georgenia soli]|nr:class II fructose-bisphosphate aldolase [Georgenia soli]
MEIIDRAVRGGYAVGAFNMHNLETTQALVRAAEQANSPVFLQVGRAIVPHRGLRAAYEMTRRVAEESDAELVIHLDHGPLEEVYEAIKLGFHSVMFDGAHLPFEENIKVTRRVVEVAHDFGIPVEAELGKIPDADEQVDWSSYYTDVAQAERFVAETGVDLLAVSVGIVHGVPMSSPQPLDIERIEKIREVTGIPLVLHGASGVPESEIRAALAAGVHKFNADTDLRHAFRAGMEAVWSEGDRQLEEAMAEGRERMIAATVEKMRLYGCADAASLAAAA